MSLELASEVNSVVALLTEMMSPAHQGAASAAFESHWRLRSGFAPLLAALAVDVSVGVDVRQMALLLLKRIVAENWNAVPSEDKAHVRQVVPQALNESVTKLQTATAMLIANIAQQDWPSEWPSFFDQLLPCLRQQDDALLRRGAIRTVHMFASADFVDAHHLPYVVDLLVPEILAILHSPDLVAFDVTSRARALAVFRSILAWVAFEKQHTLATFANAVPPVMQLCLALLAQATADRVLTDPAGSYHFEIEAVGLLSDLMARFKSHLEPVMPQCAATIVGLLAAAVEPYVALASRVGGSHQTDADGNEIGLEALVLFALECVAALCRKKSSRHLEPQLDAVCRCVVGYACMTVDDIELWQSDANEFIDGEEDTFRWSLRLCALKLSESIVNRFAVAGLNSLLASASQWCARDDWRARESAELIVGNVAGELAGANRALRDTSGAALVQFNPIEFIENVLVPDVGESQPPFLSARALWCAAQFTSDMPISLVAPFLQYCSQALNNADAAEPVLVMATKAIHKFCVPLGNSRRHEASVVQELMPGLISGLATRFADASENQLVQLVDALTVVQRVDTAATAQLAPQVLPYVLAVWSKNTNDSLMDDAVQDCVRSFTAVPACVALVGSALERPIATLLRRELADNVDALCLRNSLLLMIGAVVDGHDAVAGGPTLTAPSFLVDTALPLVADIALTTTDHEPLQNSCIALSAYARRFTPPAAGGGGGQVVELLLRCAAHLLSPSFEDAATFHVGSLVSALLGGAARALVQPHLTDVLRATYARLGVARTDFMIVELLVVFVRLFRLDADAVSQWLAAVPPDGRAPIADAEPSASGLHYVLGLWCKHHPTLVGAFVTKLSAATLIQLAGSPLGDMPVPGRLIVEERRAGPRRSSRQAARAGQAAAAAERYTSVPLRVKVVQLLASNYRDALLMDLTAGVPDAIADEFEDDGDESDEDDEVDLFDDGDEGAGGGEDDDDDDEDPNAHFYRLLSQYDSEDDEQDGDREEVDEPDIVHDPLYPVKFNVMLEHYFGTTARDTPQVLQQASDEGLLDKQQRQDIESAVQAFQQTP